MKERYLVEVTRTVTYSAVVEVDAEDPAVARIRAREETRRRGFAWSEDEDEISTGEITVPANQPRRRRR